VPEADLVTITWTKDPDTGAVYIQTRTSAVDDRSFEVRREP
jgi:hypothetical protein